ncbi:MAG TPA: aldo/keto reductase [Salinisphaeraceae bacterium]|nr:aldo/keto reductase [Salinisphaeraceae bacterium]
MEYVTANGATIPALGFGTFQLPPEDAEAMTAHALKTGYRHVDTAQMYENEAAVASGIRQSGVARADIFLTTKIPPQDAAEGDLQRAAEQSLRQLDTDQVDLLLLHWPNPDVPLAETMAALNEVREQGMARHIGVSNFTTTLLAEAVAQSSAPLVVNQVEYHPYLSQAPVRSKLAEHGMALTAYCPLAQGQVFEDATLERIGAAHGKNPGQVALRWLLQQEQVIAIPRSSKAAHVASNFDVFDFELDDAEMAAISALQRADGRIVSPTFAPVWDN